MLCVVGLNPVNKLKDLKQTYIENFVILLY